MAWRSCSWDFPLRISPLNGFVTDFFVISAVVTNARDGFLIRDLLEKARQHRRVASGLSVTSMTRISSTVAAIPRWTCAIDADSRHHATSFSIHRRQAS